ncbi:MAG TPA: GDP-mannose 4,6-dehydratase [Patescibacteria group bacterium]|nr:GDP-mannose 4,6-dehydratase [Patescibacteria group bacterium]
MRVLVTGATGFVGRWLARELEANGHDVVRTPASSEFDIADAPSVRAMVQVAGPDAVAHLAAISFAGDARRDPAEAFRVNVGGTAAVLDAVRRLPRRPVALIAGSSEVYGPPDPGDLPLRENAPLLPSTPYGLSKLAQEAVAIELAAMHGLGLVVTRAFNHIGPGQRADFVVPAIAARIVDVLRGNAASIRIGNADVRRDFTDVRDVVRAYRLLLEATVADTLPARQMVVNVASGRPVSIRWIAETLKRLAGCEAEVTVDPALVRQGDPPEIVGSATLLTRLTGWASAIALERTLADILADMNGQDR